MVHHVILGLKSLGEQGVSMFGPQYRQAEEFLQQSIAIYERTLGPEAPSLSDPLLNLATLYVSEKRYSEAVELYRRAMPLRERMWGADHPKLAEPLENYALALRKIEEYAEAEKIEVRATRIRVRMALRGDGGASHQ
jgi:tetratricopeptide (TPR) repeat protein